MANTGFLKVGVGYTWRLHGNYNIRVPLSLMSTHGKVEVTMGLCRGDVGFGITLMSAMSEVLVAGFGVKGWKVDVVFFTAFICIMVCLIHEP